MDINKMLEVTKIAIDAIFDEPEEVLRILGREKAMQLIKKLSVSPAMETMLKESPLMQLIESGAKYTTGHIPMKEERIKWIIAELKEIIAELEQAINEEGSINE